MCKFCEGKEKISLKRGTAYVKDEKFLIVDDKEDRYIYALSFCPECGKELPYNKFERIYVTNITEDSVIMPECMKDISEYMKNPLHRLICDKGYKKGEFTEKQIGFIIPESKVEDIKENGYCDIICTKIYQN